MVWSRLGTPRRQRTIILIKKTPTPGRTLIFSVKHQGFSVPAAATLLPQASLLLSGLSPLVRELPIASPVCTLHLIHTWFFGLLLRFPTDQKAGLHRAIRSARVQGLGLPGNLGLVQYFPAARRQPGQTLRLCCGLLSSTLLLSPAILSSNRLNIVA